MGKRRSPINKGYSRHGQKAWGMRCILAGGTAMKLILEGQVEEAKAILSKLPSQLSRDDIDYIVFRLIVVKTSRPPYSV